MLSPERLELYCRMTPDERLALTIRMTNESLPYLFMGSPELVRRRFARLRQENDARNRNIIAGLRAAEKRHEDA